MREKERGSHPDANSPLDSFRGLPPSMVMMVAMSSSAASTRSYHLHACTSANVLKLLHTKSVKADWALL